MRPELKEYNLDWMYAKTLRIGSKIKKGSSKEWLKTFNYTPYFKGLLEPVYNLGETGSIFLELLAEYYENIITAKERGKKVGMTTFCFSPVLYYAMDIVPVTLEAMTVVSSLLYRRGAADFMDYCVEVGFTDTSCSSQRGSLGAYLAGMGADIDVVVSCMGGVCDTNANAYAFAAEYLGVPFYDLNYPASLTSPEANAYHRDDYKALVSFVQSHTGAELDLERLHDLLEEMKRQDEVLDQIEELMMMVPCPVPGVFNLLIFSGRFLAAGLPAYTALLQSMLDVARRNAEQGLSGLSGGNERCRAFFFYIDNFAANLSLWNWLDHNGISSLGSILSRHFADTSPYITGVEGTTYSIKNNSLDEMIDTLADVNARMPMTRTIRGPYNDPNMWLEDSLSLSRLYHADCCIYGGTPGCRNTWSNVKLISRDLEKSGYPTHIIYGDSFDHRVESWDSTEERLEEFFSIRGLL